MLMRMMYRVILTIATLLFVCNLWIRDVEQAYIHLAGIFTHLHRVKRSFHQI